MIKSLTVSLSKAMAESQTRSFGSKTVHNDYFGGTLVSGANIEKGD